jgi:hypothetical protein
LTPSKHLSFSIIVACNDDTVLHSSLLASPDLADLEISVHRGASSAANAYNSGIAATMGEVMIFVHQDMFLPSGWLPKLRAAIDFLDQTDPSWGVLGMFGITDDGTGHGFVYSTGLGRFLGKEFEGAREVNTLDEIILIIQRSSGLRFDEQLPGFHLYAADICSTAKSLGRRSYAFATPAIHNSNGMRLYPMAFWRSYFYLRRKWWHTLPMRTPCISITHRGTPALRYFFRAGFRNLFRRVHIGRRVSEPDRLFTELVGGKSLKETAHLSRDTREPQKAAHSRGH